MSEKSAKRASWGEKKSFGGVRENVCGWGVGGCVFVRGEKWGWGYHTMTLGTPRDEGETPRDYHETPPPPGDFGDENGHGCTQIDTDWTWIFPLLAS